MSNKRDIWIKAGYKEFARFGADSLAVDRLAALVGKSRSSFYHLFGDRERYLEMLGDYHMAESRQVAMELDNATSFYPDFAHLLNDHKDWAFSHMQTFHKRNDDKKYLQVFTDVTAMIEPKVGHLWTKTVGLDDLPHAKTKELYRVIRESMFSKMNYEAFTPEQFNKAIKRLNASLSFLFANAGTGSN